MHCSSLSKTNLRTYPQKAKKKVIKFCQWSLTFSSFCLPRKARASSRNRSLFLHYGRTKETDRLQSMKSELSVNSGQWTKLVLVCYSAIIYLKVSGTILLSNIRLYDRLPWVAVQSAVTMWAGATNQTTDQFVPSCHRQANLSIRKSLMEGRKCEIHNG